MVLNEEEIEHNDKSLIPQVGLPKQPKIGMLNNYIYHNNDKNILTEIEEPKNVLDQINTLINKYYEKKYNQT